jgi:hypothetical protein
MPDQEYAGKCGAFSQRPATLVRTRRARSRMLVFQAGWAQREFTDVSIASPARKKENQTTPVRKGATFAQRKKRLGRWPGAGYPPQPDAILPPAIEPDYRGCEHLLYGMHVSIVGAPRFHILGMHGVDQIIVASRPSRVMVLARRILDEQAIQSVLLAPRRQRLPT